MPPPLVPLPLHASALTPEEREKLYVHEVYDQIAPHFSQTRYKPWPVIAGFLASLSPGSIGIDSGTGNGKYLPLDQDGKIMTLGLDRSLNLLKIAQTNSIRTPRNTREVLLGDALDCCWRRGSFDYAISIATLHHLVTHARRKTAVKSLLRAVRPSDGRVLLYVWAVQQDDKSKRTLPESEAGIEQDLLVPWVLNTTSTTQQHPQVFNRYYHFFEANELRLLVEEAASELGLGLGEPGSANGGAGVQIVQDGWERSNLYIELRLWKKS